MRSFLIKTAASLSLALLLGPAYADDYQADSKQDLFAGHFPNIAEHITPILELRYRYEFVDQYSKKDAKASTLRTRFGFETKEHKGLKFLIEGENVGVIGHESYYSTVNGKSKFAKVPDPDVTELNRLQLSANIIPDTSVTIGRQLIDMGSKYFIGSQDWRQNQTTYDALKVTNNSLVDTELAYAYIMKQHNNLGYDAGGDVDTQIHALDARYSGFSFSNITPYIYLIENEDMTTSSNWTAGVYAKGKNKIQDGLYLLHDFEYARQGDYQNNTNSFNLDYYRVNTGLKWSGFTFKAGWDIAEGDGTTGLITTFADNHEFHGWEDKFAVIPANGLEDKYLEISYKLKGTESIADGLKFIAQYHDYSAENSSANYGEEWDFKLAKQFTPNVYASFYYETYTADTFSKDTDKTIFQLGFRL